jgi:DNA-binding FadR family transcriptional regulator
MRILSGELKPGQTLTTEESASAAMGVSRAAYREAMRTLAAKGLITSQPKVGTKVAPREDWSILDPDLLAWSFEAEPDEQFIRDLFELRNTVEPTAASIAAGRRDESDLSALSRSLAGMTESAPDTIEWLSTIVDFHHSLLLASKNEALAALWPAIGLTLRWSVKLQMILPALRSTRDSLADHARIFECIASQNSSAAHAAMTKLIEWTFADTIHNLRRVSRATASQAVTDR